MSEKGSFHPPSSSSTVKLVPHKKIEGLFVGNGGNTLYTKNLVPGEAHSNEILLSVENGDGTEVEYREWNPSRSKLAAAILCGADNIWIKPGSRVLYLGVDCGTTISHISDLVGPEGIVYVVEFKSQDTPGNQDTLVKMAALRFNIVPIIGQSIFACRYRMLIDMVDVMFATVDDLNQAMVTSGYARNFLKGGGHYVIYVKASQMGITSQGGEGVFACLGSLSMEFMPIERLTMKLFDKDHGYAVGVFRMLES